MWYNNWEQLLFSWFSVSGLGFGILGGAFSLINVLADMVGPGTIGIHGDSKYFFLASGKLHFMSIYIL